MGAERWQTIERLYHLALEQEQSRRAAFLEQACTGDDSLRLEVESLLAQGERHGSFLETPALEVAAKALAQDQAGAAGGTSPIDPMIGATISRERARDRVDHAGIPGPATTRVASFAGTSRFELRRCLGSGGFGVVYEAYDREHDALVALKTLQQLGAGGLYRFKHEFRALADIDHPNLITLYELSTDGEHWFFTMELVEGVNFLRYVSSENQAAEPKPDMDRLRGAFRQLAEGVSALHQAGKLHCDLKPSNVLVERSGRVVILDFGLVTESDTAVAQEDDFLVGTPAYMSPEQASGLLPSAASDWYSVGVMLFEALTGRQPFRGSVAEILEHKRRRDPPAPADLASGLPPDLDALCCRLLSRDPQHRPTDEEVLRCLRGHRPDSGEALQALNSISRAPFIGRERQLAVLREAFESTREGRFVTVWVHSRSGVGKTALVARFLDEVRQRNDLVVLEGRCYEREAVPYKALDSVVDHLGRYVKRLPRADAQALMPPDLAALMRLFPVLREWREFSGANIEAADIPDLKELRQRGFAALRQVLDRVAMRQPVVMFIDDLQWGDEDSAQLLADLITDGAAALLFVASYRSEEADTSPLLRRLTPLRAAPSTVDLALEELEPPQAEELAATLLAAAPSPAVGQARSIAREAQGNPFLIGELVRYAQALEADPQARIGAPALNDVILARCSRLSAATRRLLEVVAVAGQPVDLHLARRAARISGHAEVHQLRSARLVRIRKTDGAEQVETYHDRIREVTEASLDQELLKQHHYQLAVAWEASTQAGPRVLAIHFRFGGIPDKAVHYAVEAARQAEAALAFGGADDSYRLALEALLDLPETPERDRRELEIRHSAVRMLNVTRGFSAPETIDANERASALAEKSGNLRQLFSWVIARQAAAAQSGDLGTAGALADQALKLALREGSPVSLGLAHGLQMWERFYSGDFAGVEKHFTAGLKFFDDAGLSQFPGAAIFAFFYASASALRLGHADVARERMTRMTAAADANNPFDMAASAMCAAAFRNSLREYEQAEVAAVRGLEVAQKHGFLETAANCRCSLGYARAQLGRATEGIALIRQGIARLLELGSRADLGALTAYLAIAQFRTGAIGDALETAEQALQANADGPYDRCKAFARLPHLLIRGELRRVQGQLQLAEADFHEAIAMARSLGAKTSELGATMGLARLLDKQGKRDEARTMLSEIYGWFTEGFDTADLKDAKALLDELSA